MRHIVLFLAAALICSWSSSGQAQAELRVLEVSPGQSWSHEPTGLVAAGEVEGFALQKVSDSSSQLLDIIIEYRREDGSLMTLYIYRPAVDNAPLWFDAAQRSLRANPRLKSLDTGIRVQNFSLPGQDDESGLLAVYALDSDRYQSTAVAMLPLDGWLVKLRYTSTDLAPDLLAAKIPQIFDQLDWPEPKRPRAKSLLITECESKLKLKEKVKRFRPSMADALIAGVSSQVEEADEKKAVVYCRDPELYDDYAIYRANGRKTGYVLPLSDAGRALAVGQNSLGGILSGDTRRRYSPAVLLLDRVLNYPDIDKLPVPSTLLAATGDDAVISSTTTWPEGDTTVNIGVTADDDD